MIKTDDIEQCRERVFAARNASDLPLECRDALAAASDMRVHCLEIYRDAFPIALRFYRFVAFQEVKKRLKVPYLDRNGNDCVRTVNTHETVEVVLADLWEVQGFCADIAEMSGTWVYTDAGAASSALTYFLMLHLGMKPEKTADGTKASVLELLAELISSMGVTSAEVVPEAPLDDLETNAVNRKALIVRTLEAKESGAGIETRKQLAVDLYFSGEENIRHISRLTGLARGTVYKALQSAGLISRRAAPDAENSRTKP
ncbi:hypothetical protein FXF51_47940 [Nonomuraea sp. PA05]|uniref:hypothetical protein n=1 Tax=Nonomuraea sp. PA05 TaxID=2604466 RepID=UPI0011DA70E5|nr:hypothetical protein [Nonomuraea sp. PA05]TYB54372.1 hypothetical protein FXF51_47940 [Nonomuraea sp. PA05]